MRPRVRVIRYVFGTIFSHFVCSCGRVNTFPTVHRSLYSFIWCNPEIHTILTTRCTFAALHCRHIPYRYVGLFTLAKSAFRWKKVRVQRVFIQNGIGSQEIKFLKRKTVWSWECMIHAFVVMILIPSGRWPPRI